jgi:2-polyprenyl-3-methyl-5-hydroxy-6-metoxy-1,4-benzoquinol methylase
MLTNKIILENKWAGMNWNHHAVTNEWLIRHVEEQEGAEVLHIGCGIGTLSIELKDIDPVYHMIGVEDHCIRREIANMFLDELYEWDEDLNFLKMLKENQFDTIIVECMIEKSGLKLLELIKPFLKDNGQVLVRIFNFRHITTLERIVTGMVGGNLLCASSDEFRHFFDKDVKEELVNQYGYCILDELEVKKSFTIKQENIMESMKEYSDYEQDGRVYNRLYQLKRTKH